MDYLKNSYNENAIQKAVFGVPSYCQRQCEEIIR